MWRSLLLLAAATLADVHGACHVNEDLYYKEIGCVPQDMDPAGCVTSYDCSSLNQRRKDMCHYQGRSYKRGENLDPSPKCLGSCHCGHTLEGNDMPTFICANVECPELFNGPPRKGCYHVYEHDKCCYVDEICEDETAAGATCDYKGTTYRQGQRFYPDDAPCATCICQPGFNGTLEEPFCKKLACNLELHYGERFADGCVPVYYGDKGCCPIDWRCPEKTDTVVAVKSKDKASVKATGKFCEFGKLKMQIGDVLNAHNEGVKCECRVPPQPLCVQPEDTS